MWSGFALAIAIMLMGTGYDNDKTISIFFAIGWVIFLASLVQAFIFYVCPHCGHSLMDVRGEIPNHCPKCGKKLKEE